MIWFLLGCLGTTEKQTCTIDGFPLDSFLLLPDQERIQIHADVASDGFRTWVVYNLPNDENQFETHMIGLDCSGDTFWGPKRIMESSANQTTPRIAVSGERILVATHEDSGEAPYNLSIRLQLLNQEGELLESRIWDEVIGTVTEGNRWLPSVVGTEEGFWLAAAAARGDHFQTAVQALDMDGRGRGAAHWVGPDAYAVFPNIDARGDRYAVAWETGEDGVQWAEGDVNGTNGEIGTIDNSGAPRILLGDEPGVDEPSIFAHQLSPTIVQLNGENLSQDNYTHTPNAARGEETTLFAHYRIQSGTANDLVYGTIADQGTMILDQLFSSDPPAAPYRPALTHVVDDTYFVVWSEGNNPDFRIRGQFVGLGIPEL